ncbi:MAG: TaqI-like C-terminal specificity domain-containing protein [Candidatus Gastranaerophilales bacterium]|nr:TaqI-like C-terminal specificity domain-containing protein [Candidatus Gastranaerophilales bacterium]
MSKEILQDIIDSFAPDKFSRFFRDKNRSFSPRQEDVRHYDDENFKGGLKLGEIQFSKTEKLIVCAFQVKQSLSERSGKKAQYEKGKKILKDTQSDAGIVIFYDQNGNFRFSLIYPETIGNRRQWSSFKRFTYFVSREFTNKTFLQRIGDNEFSSIGKIKDAFSVEKVTKEFYLEYRKLFESLVKDLLSNHTFMNEASKNDINTENFAKKLLGQIVFIYFIQKKGWMGVPAGQNWGAGDKNFLINQFKEAIAKKSNFFNDYLESLFYGTLNNPRRNSADPSFSKEFNSRIPFLNGGLFEAEYDWKNSFIYLDNNIFKNIFDVFERFNFTVEEESPDDKEIAVDPEMLGKVFENLLPENLRKGTGTYYTPREIVYYMCQESLINYLDSSSKLGKEKVDKCVKSLKEGDSLISDKEAIEFDRLLEQIKICDPACGSGAFLVGMLNEIVRLRLLLRVIYPSKLSKRSEYQLKKDTIHNCVYGVDIDPGAIEIAKLRLWLTLVVDYEIKEIEPLPNLDYRLMCGNSLLEEFEGVRFYTGDDEKQDFGLFKDTKKQEKIVELKKKVEEYFDIHDDEEKRSKRKEINDIKDWLIKTALEKRRKELASYRKSEESKLNMFNEESRKKYFENWGTKFLAEGKINEVLRNLHDPRKAKPFFIWKLEFMDVFEDKGGFDVVIANPPYVTTKYGKIGKQAKEQYSKCFESAYDKLDLYVLFIEKAIKISKEHGFTTFITPWNFLANFYSFKIRKFLLDNTRIRLFNKLPPNVFGSVIVDNIISIFERNRVNKENRILFDDLFDSQKQRYFNQDLYSQNDKYIFVFPGNEAANNILKKMKVGSLDMGKIALNYIGIMTGGQKKMIADKPIFKNSKPVLCGKDIIRWKLVDRGNYVNFDKSKIHSNDNEEVYLSKKKILLRKTGREFVACLDEEQFFTIQSLYNIVIKDCEYAEEYLLALLNSTLFVYVYNKFFITNPEVFPYVKRRHLDQFPVKALSETEQKPLIEIVNKILKITEDSDYIEDEKKQAKVREYEHEIDQMVYKLYGLTKEEIQIIESFWAER